MTESSASAAVNVPVDPISAFTAFTDEIDSWWVRGPINFFDGRRHVGKDVRTVKRHWQAALAAVSEGDTRLFIDKKGLAESVPPRPCLAPRSATQDRTTPHLAPFSVLDSPPAI